MAAYFRSIEAFSADDNFEGLWEMAVIPSLVGNEFAPLYNFRAKILHSYKLAGFVTIDEFRSRFEAFPLVAGFRAGGMTDSKDGLVRISCFSLHVDSS